MVVIILLTRALHCYIHYRANREREEAPPSTQDGAHPPATNRIPTPPPDPETQPSLSQNQKGRKSPPRRRRKQSQTAQVCAEVDCDVWHDVRTVMPAHPLRLQDEMREGSNHSPPALRMLDAATADCGRLRPANSSPELLRPPPSRQEEGGGSGNQNAG